MVVFIFDFAHPDEALNQPLGLPKCKGKTMTKHIDCIRQYLRYRRLGITHARALRWAKAYAYVPLPF